MRQSLYLATILLFCFSLRASEIDDTLHDIPLTDQKKIERLFSFFIEKDCLGYILFGDTKPLCYTEIPLTNKNYALPYKIDHPITFQRGLRSCWDAWVRHQHRFYHPNIIICEEYDRINTGLYLRLFFINKRTLKSLLERHREHFIEVLGSQFDPDQFIQEIEKKKKIRSLIKHNEKLLGLLLGFGSESATAFQDFKDKGECGIPLHYIGKRPAGCPIMPVSFRGNKHSKEVKELTAKYALEIQDIEKIYKSDQFFMTTLEAFCAP